MSSKDILERQIRELERKIAEDTDEKEVLLRRLSELRSRAVESVHENHSQLLKG